VVAAKLSLSTYYPSRPGEITKLKMKLKFLIIVAATVFNLIRWHITVRLNLLATHMVIVESGVNLITPRRWNKTVVK
jgi:hypothetical protein